MSENTLVRREDLDALVYNLAVARQCLECLDLLQDAAQMDSQWLSIRYGVTDLITQVSRQVDSCSEHVNEMR